MRDERDLQCESRTVLGEKKVFVQVRRCQVALPLAFVDDGSRVAACSPIAADVRIA
jgi:hypothetical protein